MDSHKKSDLFISTEEMLAPVLAVILAVLFVLAFFHFNHREEVAFFGDGVHHFRPCQTCARPTHAHREALDHFQPPGT
jgi:hypothetical protein